MSEGAPFGAGSLGEYYMRRELEMKKVGQPGSAVEITAGRRNVISALVTGRANREEQAMAANWLRDLTVHRGESLRRLEVSATYNALMTGTLNNAAMQKAAAAWIEALVLTAKENPVVTEDELIAKGQRETLSANSMQVGGDHYNRRPIQHWDFVTSHDYGYLEGQITKYLFRWRDKNGVQDLQKASHFLQKLAEVSESDAAPINLQEFLDANSIPEDERSIFVALHAYHGTLDPTFLIYAQDAMRRLLARAGSKTP